MKVLSEGTRATDRKGRGSHVKNKERSPYNRNA